MDVTPHKAEGRSSADSAHLVVERQPEPKQTDGTGGDFYFNPKAAQAFGIYFIGLTVIIKIRCILKMK